MTARVRNLRFATGPQVPRHWHGGRRAVTTFFDNLSVFFPEGERFFVASVKAFEPRVTDPELKADVRLFSGQEGIHAREHVRYNEMLAAHGYPVAEMERRIKRLLAGATGRLGRKRRLGVTCALEHFTALLGELVLSDPRALEGADPTMAALWRWHSAEENEHKAVAFDVFRAVGGTYLQRASTMMVASGIFWVKVLEHQVRMMSVDGTLWSLREWGDLFRFLFVNPGGLQKMFPHWLAYFRPGFHPNDRDGRALTLAWETEFGERAA